MMVLRACCTLMHPFTLIEGDGSQNDNYNKDATRVVPDQVSSLRGSTGRNDGEEKVEQNQQNCPTGKSFPIYGNLCQSPKSKIFRFIRSKNQTISDASRPASEGRIMIVTNVGR